MQGPWPAVQAGQFGFIVFRLGVRVGKLFVVLVCCCGFGVDTVCGEDCGEGEGVLIELTGGTGRLAGGLMGGLIGGVDGELLHAARSYTDNSRIMHPPISFPSTTHTVF